MKIKPLILMTHSLPSDWVGDQLKDYQVVLGNDNERGIDPILEEHLPEALGILSLLDDPLPGEVLASASKLKVISNMAVGTDNIDLDYCTSYGIPVGHTPGVLTDGTADLTLALLLNVCRLLPQANQDAMTGRWRSWNPSGWLGRDLRGATVGILGLGKIGTAVAERLIPFGPDLIFTNRSAQPEKASALPARQVDLDELLSTSDFLCIHVPLTDQTIGLIDESAFNKMKPNLILINAARGQVVDTDALLHALSDGRILAAGLDVTDPEPLPPEHPLFKLENCFITPHIGSATVNTRKVMAEIAIANLRAGIDGRSLPYCVNPEVYMQSTK
jgi:lactate dehydrogenase-like 2-hydroxyacid dehydrogenase